MAKLSILLSYLLPKPFIKIGDARPVKSYKPLKDKDKH